MGMDEQWSVAAKGSVSCMRVNSLIQGGSLPIYYWSSRFVDFKPLICLDINSLQFF
jgi:hypothetical protein